MFKTHAHIVCSFFFLGVVTDTYAQHKVDSLKQLLLSDKADTTKVKHLNAIGWEIRSKNADSSLLYSTRALTLARRLLITTETDPVKNTLRGEIGLALHQVAYAHFLKGNYPFSLTYGQKALDCWDSLLSSNFAHDRVLARKAASLGNMGIVYSDQGNYTRAQELYLMALKTIRSASNMQGDESKATPDQKQLIAKNFGNLGIVYRNLNDLPKALEYYFEALRIDKELKNKHRIAADLGNLGNVYSQQKNYEAALNYYNQALTLDKEIGNTRGIAIHLGNLGLVYQSRQDLKQALVYFFEALAMRQKLGDRNYIAIQLGNIGALYLAEKKYTDAERYLLKALAISDSVGLLNEKISFENSLGELYVATGDYKKAYTHYKAYSVAKDSIFNLEKNKELTRNEMTYEFEKKEAIARAEQGRQVAINEAEDRRQKLFMALIAVLAIAAGIIALVVFRSLRVTRTQKHVIEEKNRQITDSIDYAKNIQNAILPAEALFKSSFPESFILFLPKDIVSGDFYWFSSTPDGLLLAAVDCVGHGVPGAFMALHGYNLLEGIVKEEKIHGPALLLDSLNKKVIESLKQQNEGGSAKHGMDLALLKIKNSSVEFSGARNPLVVVDGAGELTEVKGDRMYIGGAIGNFSNHALTAAKDSMLYIFTDGYADQKGGPENKKFFAEPLRALFTEIAQLSCEEQKAALENKHNAWRGDGEQLDDILIIGIRV